jgi:hypothetical protein
MESLIEGTLGEAFKELEKIDFSELENMFDGLEDIKLDIREDLDKHPNKIRKI